jgi:hypothetical protein
LPLGGIQFWNILSIQELGCRKTKMGFWSTEVNIKEALEQVDKIGGFYAYAKFSSTGSGIVCTYDGMIIFYFSSIQDFVNQIKKLVEENFEVDAKYYNVKI